MPSITMGTSNTCCSFVSITVNGWHASTYESVNASTTLWFDSMGRPIDPKKLKKFVPAPLNHRGREVRSFHKDKQFAEAHPNEIVALHLLRKMVAPDVFKRYLQHGFVSVRAASGLVYQIPRWGSIQVWDRSERIASLCVHLRHDISAPPTDHVVGKMLIVECDEKDIWRRANISWHTDDRRRKPLEVVEQAHTVGRYTKAVA